MRTYIQKESKEVPATNGKRGSREGLPIGHTCTTNNPRPDIVVFHKDPNGNRPGPRPSWVILGRTLIMLQ